MHIHFADFVGEKTKLLECYVVCARLTSAKIGRTSTCLSV